MSFNATEFANELLKDANLPEDQKAILQSALSNTIVAKRLEEGTLRQSDYSRLTAEAQTVKTQAKAYYDELVAWKAQEAQRLEAERVALANPNPNPSDSTIDYLSKADFNVELQKLQEGAIGYLSTINNTSINHFKEFGETLDTNAVLKKAKEDGTNYVIAYERLVQPRREEKTKAEFEARITRERKEAVAEALANASLPTAQTNTMNGGIPHVLDAIKNQPAGAKFGWEAAVQAHTRDMANGNVKTMSTDI